MTTREHGSVQRGQARTGPCVAIGTVLAEQLRQLSMIVHRGFVESCQARRDRQHTVIARFNSFRLHVQEHGTPGEQLFDTVYVAESGSDQQAYFGRKRVGDRWAPLLQDVSHDIDQLVFELLATIVEPLLDGGDGYVQK